jgi:hypothetical protein
MAERRNAVLGSVLMALFGCDAPLIQPLVRCRFSSECELGVVCSERGFCEAPSTAALDVRSEALPAADLVVSEIEYASLTCGGQFSPRGAFVPENCVQRAAVTITNRGAVQSDTPFTLQAAFDPTQSMLVTQEVNVQLGPRQTLQLQLETPPGRDCSPYCRVCATVDATERVSEADETNNQSCTLARTSVQLDAPAPLPDNPSFNIDDFQDLDSSPTPRAWSPWSCFADGAEGQNAECGITLDGYPNVAYGVQFDLQDPLDGVHNPLLAGARTTLTEGTLNLTNGEFALSARLEATTQGAPEGFLYVRLGCGRQSAALEARVQLADTWGSLRLQLASFTAQQPGIKDYDCASFIDSVSIGFEPTLADGETASGRLLIDNVYAN